MSKTHWKLLSNPDYVGAYWLPPGEDVTVTIDFVAREMAVAAADPAGNSNPRLPGFCVGESGGDVLSGVLGH